MRKYLISNHATKEKIIVEANSAQEAAKKVGYRIKRSEVTDIGQPKLSGIPIEKAIELLSYQVLARIPLDVDNEHDAIQLGIEALKAVELERETYAFERIDILPGETRK